MSSQGITHAIRWLGGEEKGTGGETGIDISKKRLRHDNGVE